VLDIDVATIATEWLQTLVPRGHCGCASLSAGFLPITLTSSSRRGWPCRRNSITDVACGVAHARQVNVGDRLGFGVERACIRAITCSRSHLLV